MRLTATNAPDPSYAVDSTGSELRLLGVQVLSVLDLTEDVLRRSGIELGMRVLDLGCGAGDASLWIAKLVGPTGLVVGVDESAEAIDVAQKRATVALLDAVCHCGSRKRRQRRDRAEALPVILQLASEEGKER